MSTVESKQQGRFPTPPIHLNLSGKEQSGTRPCIQKLPLLEQSGSTQLGILLSKVILLTHTGRVIKVPIQLKSSSGVQSGINPFEQYVPFEHSGTTITPEEEVVDVEDVVELPEEAPEQIKVISGRQIRDIPLPLQHSIGWKLESPKQVGV